jgi:hypothetical protein
MSKETAVSDVKNDDVMGTERVESNASVALMDCGKASEVTKGYPIFGLYEGGPYPFDRIPL